MAGCERGYLCTVCGQDVEEITDSVLYLRYVMGDVEWDQLNRAPETHIRCDKTLAQFIVDESFEAVRLDGRDGCRKVRHHNQDRLRQGEIP